MPPLPDQDITSKKVRIEEAVYNTVEGIRDQEGRSPIVELASDISDADSVSNAWQQAIIATLIEGAGNNGSWWREVELFLTLINAWSDSIADALENILACHNTFDSIARASIYSILAGCSRALPAETLFRDSKLRDDHPVLWLDLILPSIPVIKSRQGLVLDAIARRAFGIEHFEQRLDEMRNLGGRRLGDWLAAVREALPAADRPRYDAILTETGFSIVSIVSRSEETETRSARATQDGAFSQVYDFGNRTAVRPARYDRLEVAIS